MLDVEMINDQRVYAVPLGRVVRVMALRWHSSALGEQAWIRVADGGYQCWIEVEQIIFGDREIPVVRGFTAGPPGWEADTWTERASS